MFRSVVVKRLVVLSLLLAMLCIGSCGTVGYYYQSVHGHFSLLGDSRPIQELLQDEKLDADLRQKLQLVLEMRAFASAEMGLPRNGSYLSYADLNREAVVWSVVATQEFSVEPKQWCYPVIGCASYRGYFKKGQAQEYADDLKKNGLDVTLLPNPAYSTLGWFDDPLPSTVIRWPEPQLAGLIFHELAHQQLYIADDSPFNEAFAMTVEQVGIERWVKTRHDQTGLKQWRQRKQRRDEFVRLLLDARARLQRLYASKVSVDAMRTRKQTEFARLRHEYLRLKRGWQGYGGFDHWFDEDLNNARLASVATYDRYVPAFLKLLQESNGDLQRFYQVCKQLGELPPEQRTAQLDGLLR
jgi:predicted aminopeptidase